MKRKLPKQSTYKKFFSKKIYWKKFFSKKHSFQKNIQKTIIYKISDKNFKLIGQAVLKLQWSPISKTWFREKRV